MPIPDCTAKLEVGAVAYGAKSFDDLREWLVDLPNQSKTMILVLPSDVLWECSENEVFIDTPENRAFAEMVVASRMKARIAEGYQKGDQIDWRVPFQHDLSPVQIVDEYANEGSHYDLFQGRSFIPMAGPYARIRAYCRFVARRKSEVDASVDSTATPF